jgi:hypothetical protein
LEQETAQHAPEPEPAPSDDLQPVTAAVTVPAEPTTAPSPEPAAPAPDEASGPNRALQDPTQPGHPDHALYQQIREGVEALDAKHGRSFDEVSERMTASLLVLAKDNDLERVDHVLVSNATREHPAGHTLFVVQGEPSNPAHQRAAMPTELAAQTSVEESLQQFDQSAVKRTSVRLPIRWTSSWKTSGCSTTYRFVRRAGMSNACAALATWTED